MNAIWFYRLSHYLYKSHVPILPRLLYWLIFLLFNSSIPYKSAIGRGTVFGYGGMGVVIHDRVIIGENCIIGQQVTIGGKSGAKNPPVIGNRVYIAAGAKIIGDIKIGDNCVIGANSVVLNDIPDNCVAVGIPARIIKENIKNIEFYFGVHND